MENLAFDKNVRQRMVQIVESMRIGEELSMDILKEVKMLFTHPNMTGAHLRNSVGAGLPEYYRKAEELAKSIIEEIEALLTKK